MGLPRFQPGQTSISASEMNQAMDAIERLTGGAGTRKTKRPEQSISKQLLWRFKVTGFSANNTRFQGRRIDQLDRNIDEEDIEVMARTSPRMGEDLGTVAPRKIVGSWMYIKREFIRVGSQIEDEWWAIPEFIEECDE